MIHFSGQLHVVQVAANCGRALHVPLAGRVRRGRLWQLLGVASLREGPEPGSLAGKILWNFLTN